MISNDDKYKISEIAKKYKISKLYLFGSIINDEDKENSNDIDLGVEGIPDSLFFKFYSELIFNLTKPVDLIDLRNKSSFNEMIKSKGILIYG
jgi:predicted nucleotidyltransferase